LRGYTRFDRIQKTFVIPAQAGIHFDLPAQNWITMDPRLRGDDGGNGCATVVRKLSNTRRRNA